MGGKQTKESTSEAERKAAIAEAKEQAERERMQQAGNVQLGLFDTLLVHSHIVIVINSTGGESSDPPPMTRMSARENAPRMRMAVEENGRI
mmetsp:Transcript_37635/g.97104  ORF Transcript_37635/g.97104 Transcript_37635/m.97104 type:complete len:91 (-) Transcript_37635:482-754(-)